MNTKPIIITTGEPAGIGMDIVLILASRGFFQTCANPIWVLACHKSMHERYSELQTRNVFTNSQLLPTWHVIQQDDINTLTNKTQLTDNVNSFTLIDIPTKKSVQAGHVDIENASMVMAQLQLAHELAYAGEVLGIVTAPLQKSALIDAHLTLPDGTMFSGHTEYFMQMSQCDKVVMMLANAKLRVALVTTHLPLSQVAKAITKHEVRTTVAIVLESLQRQFAIDKPKVLVCGLNPHAGEGGHLGMEEIDIINPVLGEFQNQGHDVSDAMPADTLYTDHHLKSCDATIAMYHDQGLPVLKSHGFGDSVNITLGLPYVRTSVDHGTALDRAGRGDVDVNSLRQAIIVLQQMSGQ